MQQYNSIKAKYPDALLLFRVGDFYETFGADAVRCSKILDIVLTKRANGSEKDKELAGFPHHSLNTYLPKLVKAGLRVAICDQLEDPKSVKGIVKRGVTELVTPGVALNDEVLSAKKNNFLMAIHHQDKIFGAALLDLSTGEFLVFEGLQTELEKVIQNYQPSEIVVQKRTVYPFIESHSVFQLEDWAFQKDYAEDKLLNHFKTNSLKGFGIDELQLGTIAAGVIFAYLDDTHHFDIKHLTSIQRIDLNQFVWMDPFTIRNLELLYPSNSKGTSLLDILNKTASPMGGRLLHRWMVTILKDSKAIENRLNIVEFLVKNDSIREEIRTILAQLSDIERFVAKISTKKISPKQLRQLAESLDLVVDLQNITQNSKQNILQKLFDDSNDLKSIATKIKDFLTEDPPHLIVRGNVIAEGISTELDKLREIQFSGKDYLEKMREREVENTGISSIKIAYNNVFGYYIEVRNSHKDKVPTEWIRKQTLVNAERYITEELKEYESQILGAEEKILSIENQLFSDFLEQLTNQIEFVQKVAHKVAFIDVLSTFAEISSINHYHKPIISDELDLIIKNGRHPVIEQQLPIGTDYIPNDTKLNKTEQQIIMITGPNMSGKSALLRQTALIVIMAQLGCFVPADEATIPITDKIFTRVGASDNISSGESTFMVEMNETASILNNISERSLILLDEIGRGTSTYDGISIAWAIAEYLHNHPTKPKTLFATHYHELNEMTATLERIKNFNVSVKETKDNVLFVRKLVPGGSEHSFGIHVARMAGMPQWVLKRSNEILAVLENSHSNEKLTDRTKQITQDNIQLSFFQLDDPILESIREEILKTDINTLTPVEALMKLNEIKKKLGN